MRIVRVLALAAVLAACTKDREPEGAAPPTWDSEVGAILASRCKDCHGDDGANGWRATSYVAAIACTKEGAPASLPADDTAPILRALADTVHEKVASGDERATIEAWVRAGTPKLARGVHDPGFVDPRSPAFHGAALRARGYVPMTDATAPDACARCHDGTPSPKPDKVTTAAPGATSCTTCHTEPAGALACGTCHGDGASRASPPRDPCFHPNEGGAHLAHTAPTAVRASGLACATCHPAPDPSNPISGAHANGVVDVIADVAWDGASCSNACHTRPGGSKGRIAWADATPLGCGSCHGAPPPAHYAGACSSCHREANADGTALANPVLHVNGKVDLGDGSGTCGACHGTGASPWPSTNAHATHMAPDSAASVPCESCHEVPTSFGPGTAHPRGGPAVVTFGGRATLGGAKPTYASGACASTYCHGNATPTWTDASGAGKACGSCHGLPPPAPHVGSTTCEQCHAPVVRSTPSGPAIDPAYASRHVDGNIDRGP